MREFVVRNVNEAVATVIPFLIKEGFPEQSRNGRVLVATTPVMTTYKNPCERVLFSPLRDANPWFHLMESLWMLAGRNDLEFPMSFNKRFESYSDDGKTVHGAYGHRWRESFGYDQLHIIANELKKNPASRRCVLSMWDASPDGYDDEHGMNDLQKAMNGGKDVPCNTHAYFDARFGKLNMTVCNRSNDAVWGAYGANAVHFSVLQEYMAAWVGIPVGTYRQFSNNLHVYTDIYDEDTLMSISRDAALTDFYPNHLSKVHPLISTDIATWDADLGKFFRERCSARFDYKDPFFRDIVAPMYLAWDMRKCKEGDGMQYIDMMPIENDWRAACMAWINRRAGRKVA